MNNEPFKFAFVLMCLFISFSYGNNNIGLRDARLLRVGLFFTVCADFCMLILDENAFGLIFFCLVQTAYICRLSEMGIYRRITQLLTLGFSMAWASALFTQERITAHGPFLTAAAFVYASLWVTNLVVLARSLKAKKIPRPNNLIISWGMILFALCDLSVAAHNLSLPAAFERLAYRLIWFFYQPSQLLLSLSARRFAVEK